MAAPTKAPSEREMEKYLEKGLTQAQIRDDWEQVSGHRLSLSTISMAIKRYGLEAANPVERYTDVLPWKVRQDHQMHNDARMLRYEARRRRGKSLSDKEKRLLTDWKQALDEAGAVIH